MLTCQTFDPVIFENFLHPDCISRPWPRKGSRLFLVTFAGALLWIGAFAFLLVWWTDTASWLSFILVPSCPPCWFDPAPRLFVDRVTMWKTPHWEWYVCNLRSKILNSTDSTSNCATEVAKVIGAAASVANRPCPRVGVD